MANDELTSDPWDDLGDSTPSEPPTVEPEVPAVPPPPPPPSDAAPEPEPPVAAVEQAEEPDVAAVEGNLGESDEEEAGDSDLGALASDVVADSDVPMAADVASPDFDIPDAPSLDVPPTEAPDLDHSNALEIPDLDLSGFGVNAPELDIPDTPDMSISDLGVSEVEIPDLADGFSSSDLSEGQEDVVAPELGVPDADADVEDASAAPPIASPSRTPYSPMLAATGLFGRDTDDQATGDDVEDTDASAADVDEHEPPDFVVGATPPPSVYSELEDLSAHVDPVQVDEAHVDDGESVAGESWDQAAEDRAEEADESAIEIPWQADETDEIDESASEPFWEEDESEEPDAAVPDEDLAALAAMVADVEPIVLGDDEDSETNETPLPVDTDDWLLDADEAGAEEGGFDIGITLGSGLEEPAGPAHDEESVELDEDGTGETLAAAAALGLDAELGESQPAAEWPDLTGAEPDPLASEAPESPPVSDEGTPEDAPAEDDLSDLVESHSEDEGAHLEVAASETDEPALVTPSQEPPVVAVFDDLGEESGLAEGSEAWGARWRESAQGWVEDESGSSTWRPIVTTSPLLSEWDVDTYLGVVVGDTSLPVESATGAEVTRAREASSRRMVDEALARGAHAIVGVSFNVQTIGVEVLVTATGTAVTLRADTPS